MSSPPLRITDAVLISTADARILARAIGYLELLLPKIGSTLTPEIRQLGDRLHSASCRADATPNTTSLATLPISEHDLNHDLLTTAAAAEILGCTASNARALAGRSAVKAQSVGGRWLFDAESVRERAARR